MDTQILLRANFCGQIKDGEIPKNSQEYFNTCKEIEKLDNEMSSGAFVCLALLVNNRLFVTNLGIYLIDHAIISLSF